MNASQKSWITLRRSCSLMLLLVSGCSTQNSNLNPDSDPVTATTLQQQAQVAQNTETPFKALPPNAVQPGFLVEVSDINDKGINGKFRIDFDGKLKLSYNIEIETTGLTEAELRNKIINAYATFLKSVASIHVSLIQKKLWIDLRGLVVKPGRYLVEPESSLDEVLNAAGGIKQNAQAEYLQIQGREGTTAFSLTDYYDTGNGNRIPPFEGGMVLFAQRKSDLSPAMLRSTHPVIQMLGEVKTPGEVPFRSEEDFLYYVTKAGGPSSVADLSKIEVIRTIAGKRRSTFYNWEDSHQLAKLEPSDIVVIHSNQPTPFEKALQSGAAIGAVLSAIGILIIAL